MIRFIKKLIKCLIPKHLLIYKGSDKKKMVSLTFDDGPNPENLPDILSFLNERNIKATFFVTGENVMKYPELIGKINRNGHQIGNHFFHHKYHGKLNYRSFSQELDKTENLIYSIINKPVELIRPPYGQITIKLILYALVRKKRIVLWTNDYKDSNITAFDEISQLLLDESIDNGHILLLHEDSEVCLALLEWIYSKVESNSFVTLEKLFLDR